MEMYVRNVYKLGATDPNNSELYLWKVSELFFSKGTRVMKERFSWVIYKEKKEKISM